MGENQRLSDLKLSQEGNEFVSGPVVRTKLREGSNKFEEQTCVCVGVSLKLQGQESVF